MANETVTSNPPISLNDLVTLNREIAAFVRAGIPLELGLRGLAASLPTRLGKLADRMAVRLSNGESLDKVIESEGGAESTVYSSVISAGLRSGRLSEALETLAASSLEVQEMRRDIVLSLIHPVIVGILSYSLFVGMMWMAVPMFLDAAQLFDARDVFLFRCVRWLHSTAHIWAWAVPLVVVSLVILLCWLVRTPLDWFMTNVVFHWQNQAQFADVLKIQIDHGLPLADSFVRAADSTTDHGLRSSARTVAETMERGVPFSRALTAAPAIRPMMRWALASAGERGTLANSLGLMRDWYRARAVRQVRLVKVWLPALMTVFISGVIALVYGLFLFGMLNEFWLALLKE